MNSLELIEDNEATTVLTTEVDLNEFSDQMLRLDKRTFDRIYDDHREREIFSKLSVQDRMAYFSPEFQVEIQSIYNNFHSLKQLTHSLALNVYRLGSLTGATNKEIAERLEAALQKQFSRSYISKLHRVGKMLTAAPALAIILDTEKLAELSRIPEAKLTQMIEQTSEGIVRVGNCDVATASRAKIQEIVRNVVPAKSVIRTARQVVSVAKPVNNWNVQSLKEVLEESLNHVDQSDLSEAIVECLRIINEENL